MRSQIHGKVFEDMIKACELFSSSADSERSPTASFDIEARFDREHGLPISIKTTKTNSIGLADARKFVSISEPFKMIVGCYKQNGNIKEFFEVYQFIITNEAHALIVGNLSSKFVSCFHEMISMESLTSYDQARKIAHAINSVPFETNLSLNPKIDSKRQRRLQTSISINSLKSLCETACYTETFSNLVLPLRIVSPSRSSN